jgi:hypothetical protein
MTIPAEPNQEIAGIIKRALSQEKTPAFARVIVYTKMKISQSLL